MSKALDRQQTKKAFVDKKGNPGSLNDPGFFLVEMEQEFLQLVWAQLVWPIIRILVFVSLGLVVANFIEALNWTHRLAVLARPLIRLGNLSAITGASFSMAFFSGVSANSVLAEAFDTGKISKKELILANLFNSVPRFFLHLPTVFFLTLPFIQGAALLYVGITFGAAVLQTIVVVFFGSLLLLGHQEEIVMEKRETIGWQQAVEKSLKRLKKRIPRIVKLLIPIYILFFILNHYGVFQQIEEVLARTWLLGWLHPQSLSIVILHVTAEFSAGLAAASVLMADNSLGYREVVLALLVGNILSAPIRAIRHQFPYYVGIFNPKLAAELVGLSQVTRAATIIVVGSGYYFLTSPG